MSVSIYSTCHTVALITVLWAGGGWEVFSCVFFFFWNVAYLQETKPQHFQTVFGTELSKLGIRLQELF